MLQNAPARLPLSKTPRWVGLGMIILLIFGGGFAYNLWRLASPPRQVAQTVVSPPQMTTVTALGRLEPQGDVIQLSAPTSTSGNRVEQLLVKEGDRVEAGQVIAVLDSRDRLQAAWEQAQEDVKVAQAKLAITQAGAKTGAIEAQRAEISRLIAQRQGDIDAQAATVARLTAQVQNAQTEYNRYQTLYQEGAISASERDSKRLAYESAEKQLQEAEAILQRIRSTSPAQLHQAQANLEQISEVRPVDIRANQAEIDRALAATKQAKAALEQAYVRSPIAGEILDIHTHAGEVVSNNGIVEIGQTQQMYAIAEVYQSDIGRVKPGQTAQITSDSIVGELSGTVERIDAQVRRQTIVNTDPSTNIDARVIEVHIALDPASSQKAAKFTNLQVTVVIQQ